MQWRRSFPRQKNPSKLSALSAEWAIPRGGYTNYSRLRFLRRLTATRGGLRGPRSIIGSGRKKGSQRYELCTKAEADTLPNLCTNLLKQYAHCARLTDV